MESKLLKKQPKKDREIGVFNLERELIATFKGYFYLESLLGKHVSVCKKEPKKITGDVYYMYL